MKMDVSKVDLTSKGQKVFAVFLIGAVLMGLWYLLPPLIVILTNLWLALLLGLPLFFLVSYVIFNPMVIWNLFKQVSWNITKGLISKDKLGYMYRYHEYIVSKANELEKSIIQITGVRSKLQRRKHDLSKSIEKKKKEYIAYEEKEASVAVLRTLANQISVDTKQIESLNPRLETIIKQEQYLIELHEHWSLDAADLKYTLDRKAEEYQTMKELNEAAGNASEFLKGNSEEYKIFQESLNQIEQSVTKYTANLENFERKAAPILESKSIERTINEEEGVALIEEFKKNSVNLRIEV